MYLLTYAGTSADFTLVVARLRSGPCPFLLALVQVLTLPWGAELRSGPPTILLALGQVLTLPWLWQSLEVLPVPSDLHKCKFGQVLTLPWCWQSLEGVPLPFYLH